jgi:hypothetical protein
MPSSTRLIAGVPSQSIRVAIAALLLVVLAVACNDEPQPTGADTESSPGQNATEEPAIPTLSEFDSPGRYGTDFFEPPFSIELDSRWELHFNSEKVVAFGKGASEMSFTHPDGFINKDQQTKPVPDTANEAVATIKDTVSGQQVERADKVDVGGQESAAVDVAHSGKGVPVLSATPPGTFYIEKGKDYRFIVVDVEGELVVITLEAQGPEFDSFAKEVNPLLASVEFGF